MRIAGHKPRTSHGWTESPDLSTRMEVALVLSPWDIQGAERRHRSMGSFDREEFLRAHGIPRDTRQKILTEVLREGLTLEHESPFVVWLAGSMEAVGRTFHIGFRAHQEGRDLLYGPAEEPEVPDWMAPWVVGLVGLDNVTRVKPRLRTPRRTEALANNGQGFFPQDIASAYRFPAQYDGSGQTIGLLEFSNGYSGQDVEGFWQSMGVTAPTVDFVSVDGTLNDGGASGADMEATLDVEWAGAMAPGAHLVVYEASGGSTSQGFATSVLKALDYAVSDTVHHPSVLSISYGDGENAFAAASMRALDTAIFHGAMIGITTFVASGDQGAYGLHGGGSPVAHVDAPANCPHAVSVGGTHLNLTAQGSIGSESGWTDTDNNGASGGGVSQVFGVPTYQSHLTLPVKSGDKKGRGVPDVAANADPDTGYSVMFQGAPTVIGGTSAASPVWAALAARINQARRQNKQKPIGFMNPEIYDLGGTNVFHDITQGNNNYGGVVGYACGPGWDAVTGWGSPDATRLIQELRG